MLATFFISPAGILNTSFKAFTSSLVTTPSALAILAPSAITPTVNATWTFPASWTFTPPSTAPTGPDLSNSAVAPANFSQIDMAELLSANWVGLYKQRAPIEGGASH